MLKVTRTDAEKQPGVINELRLSEDTEGKKSDTAFDLVTIDFFPPSSFISVPPFQKHPGEL